MLQYIITFIRDTLSNIFKQKVKELMENKISKKEEINREEVTVTTTMIANNNNNNNNNNNPIEGDELLSYLDTLDLKSFGDINIYCDNDKPTVLIVDDLAMTKMLYQADYTDIQHTYNKTVSDDFKIIECLFPTAGPVAYDYIKNNKVDYAILDITLGHMLNINGILIELDGIDLAYAIKKYNPDAKFLLCTAHTANDNHIVTAYKEKLKRTVNVDFNKVYLNKNSDRYIGIYNMLYN